MEKAAVIPRVFFGHHGIHVEPDAARSCRRSTRGIDHFPLVPRLERGWTGTCHVVASSSKGRSSRHREEERRSPLRRARTLSVLVSPSVLLSAHHCCSCSMSYQSKDLFDSGTGTYELLLRYEPITAWSGTRMHGNVFVLQPIMMCQQGELEFAVISSCGFQS